MWRSLAVSGCTVGNDISRQKEHWKSVRADLAAKYRKLALLVRNLAETETVRLIETITPIGREILSLGLRPSIGLAYSGALNRQFAGSANPDIPATPVAPIEPAAQHRLESAAPNHSPGGVNWRSSSPFHAGWRAKERSGWHVACAALLGTLSMAEL
jgi:hypothetical protein